MGRRYFNLYEDICHPLNLWSAYKSAARGKRYQPAAAAFEYDLEKNLIELEEDLRRESHPRMGHELTNMKAESPFYGVVTSKTLNRFHIFSGEDALIIEFPGRKLNNKTFVMCQ